jgi:hypothetical protein
VLQARAAGCAHPEMKLDVVDINTGRVWLICDKCDPPRVWTLTGGRPKA